jgi:hypothetical protein
MDQTQVFLSPTWGRKDIQFSERCVIYFFKLPTYGQSPETE